MSYAVIYVERATGRIESVLARGMEYHHADSFVAQMAPRARDGMYFTVRNESELQDTP